MQKLFRSILAGSCCALILAGCAGSGPAVVAKIGNESISLEDFEENYAKNNGGWDKAVLSTPEEREKFLDLLVKFRLKVLEARNRGLMADSSIKKELEGYEVTVATSYMLEKEIVEPKIKEMYDRRKEELRASHILVKLGSSPTPADTIAAYEKAMKIIGMVPTAVFDSLAVHYSDDPSAATNHGDLGFFTSGRMVPEFEDACYGMKVGEYSHAPVRSQFGYHIIKLVARQPNKGAVRVSHILRLFSADKDSAAVTDSAMIIYRMAREGKNFAELAGRYSQDQQSRGVGGDIGFYERGKIPPEIEKIFYETPLDSVVPPYRMAYGYHIIKITGFKGVLPLADMQKEIRDQYTQTRYQTDYSNFVKALTKQYRLIYDTATVVKLLTAFDSTETPASWTWSDTLKPDMRNRMLLSCEGHPATVNDLIDYVTNSAEFKTLVLNPKNVQHIIERMAEVKLMEEHARQVPKRYPAFTKLLREYQDGILLYRIEQDEVWKKVVTNDSLLRVYYEQTKENYRWPKRVNFAEIFVTTDSLADLAYKELHEGKDFGDVAAKYTMRPGYKEKRGEWGFTPYDQSEVSRRASTLEIGKVPPHAFPGNEGLSILKTIARDSAKAKTFEEAMPEVMSAYQEYASKQRMDQWVADLQARYPVVTDKKLLLEAFKRKPVAAQ
ncbi:MAG TPA: peptidylprolyl isomerase [Bacteroidota bacterium]|nr:peptidylprolyl isomerase [Bacteroidota bacterium]